MLPGRRAAAAVLAAALALNGAPARAAFRLGRIKAVSRPAANTAVAGSPDLQVSGLDAPRLPAVQGLPGAGERALPVEAEDPARALPGGQAGPLPGEAVLQASGGRAPAEAQVHRAAALFDHPVVREDEAPVLASGPGPARPGVLHLLPPVRQRVRHGPVTGTITAGVIGVTQIGWNVAKLKALFAVSPLAALPSALNTVVSVWVSVMGMSLAALSLKAALETRPLLRAAARPSDVVGVEVLRAARTVFRGPFAVAQDVTTLLMPRRRALPLADGGPETGGAEDLRITLRLIPGTGVEAPAPWTTGLADFLSGARMSAAQGAAWRAALAAADEGRGLADLARFWDVRHEQSIRVEALITGPGGEEALRGDVAVGPSARKLAGAGWRSWLERKGMGGALRFLGLSPRAPRLKTESYDVTHEGGKARLLPATRGWRAAWAGARGLTGALYALVALTLLTGVVAGRALLRGRSSLFAAALLAGLWLNPIGLAFWTMAAAFAVTLLWTAASFARDRLSGGRGARG